MRAMTSGSVRYGAIALILGLTVFTAGIGTAWADPTDTRDTSVSRTESSAGAGSDTATKQDSPASKTDSTPASKRDEDDDASPKTEPSSAASTKAESTNAESTKPESTKPEAKAEPSSEPSPEPQPSPEAAAPVAPEPTEPTDPSEPTPTPTPTAEPAKATKQSDTAAVDAVSKPQAEASDTETSDTKASDTETSDTDPAPSAARTSAPTAAAVATVTSSAAAVTTVAPGPVSPIAEIAALPGRIVNAVLQVLGFTTSASTGQGPFSPAPIADLFFAVFRRIEEVLGLQTPVVQPVLPTMVYEGPLDIPTPTVKQFLDASTAEYGLGTAPGGMVPFTVDGWPLTSTHLETGSDASVWVTPQNQIIIAYSGTTGGTNLLFNPLIAITQIITDLEAGLGNTTPAAFTEALDFAERVKAEAAEQGYSADDVFVTGHSLGAWQAQYVAQQIGLNGIGFEGPGLNTTVPGNGKNSLFVNTATYGDMAGFLASDLPGLYPFAPPYVPGGGVKPHYGPIVMLGDPAANTPMVNAASLFGRGIVGSLISVVDLLGNFFAKHLPGVQAYHLDVQQDPGVVPWLGIREGPVYTGFGAMTIPEFLKAAGDAGILVTP